MNVKNSKKIASNRAAFAKFSIFKKILGKKSVTKKVKNPYIIMLKRSMLAFSFVVLVAMLAGSVVAAFWVGDVLKSTANIDPNDPFKQIANVGDSLIFAKDGTELKRISGEETRDFIKIEDVPDYVRAAFIAAEDKNFFQNKGVDPVALVRAVVNTVFKKDSLQGGSTITQQVVKVNLVGDEKSINRKLKELILAVQISNQYDKNEILQLYMNSIPFGSNIIGLKRAAKIYFSKDVKDLTYGEAALLAGIPNQPSLLAPAGFNSITDPMVTQPDGTQIPSNIARQRYVLQNMYEIADDLKSSQKYDLDKDKIKAAETDKIVYNYSKSDSRAPHFVQNGGIVYEEVKNILKGLPQYKDKTENEIDGIITSGGLRIYTTLDYDMQQKAEDRVKIIDDTTTAIPGSVCGYCSSGIWCA